MLCVGIVCKQCIWLVLFVSHSRLKKESDKQLWTFRGMWYHRGQQDTGGRTRTVGQELACPWDRIVWKLFCSVVSFLYSYGHCFSFSQEVDFIFLVYSVWVVTTSSRLIVTFLHEHPLRSFPDIFVGARIPDTLSLCLYKKKKRKRSRAIISESAILNSMFILIHCRRFLILKRAAAWHFLSL